MAVEELIEICQFPAVDVTVVFTASSSDFLPCMKAFGSCRNCSRNLVGWSCKPVCSAGVGSSSEFAVIDKPGVLRCELLRKGISPMQAVEEAIEVSQFFPVGVAEIAIAIVIAAV